MLIFNAQSYGGEKTVALVGDAEERAREGESEEKNKTSETFAKVSEEAAHLEQELCKAEEHKLKEEAERAEKEWKEAKEQAAQEERECKEAKEHAAREEEERKEAKERAAREACEAEERKKELLRLEEVRAQHEAEEKAQRNWRSRSDYTSSKKREEEAKEVAKKKTLQNLCSVRRSCPSSHMGPRLKSEIARMSILGDVVVADKQNTMSSMMVFNGIEAVKDNTCRSSYACMLAVEIRARRVVRGDKNTCKQKFVAVFKMIQPIEDGAELEAEWEGSLRLRIIWVQMSILGDMVVADKQNTMSSMMVFNGIEAAKDNTCRSSYACMLAIRAWRVARGDKNTIEDGPELEAEWEGSSSLRSMPVCWDKRVTCCEGIKKPKRKHDGAELEAE
ncbi:hypothetical protein EDB86DRAFT_2831455 [Lactarius hatsudake]|nr:hypothetical protein EDB86DRAFT_2831455 [Lactarius hatsudake]